jgi:hypothetical protein
MQMPNVKSTITDPKNKVTYDVLAYRPLSYAELVQSVRAYHAQPKVRRRRTPLKNAMITIITIHGASPGL